MRFNPEMYIVEDADGFARARRQHRTLIGLEREGLPGARAHVEYPGKHMEQERPIGNRRMVEAGAGRKGEPERPGVNDRWASDPFIVVMKPVKEA